MLSNRLVVVTRVWTGGLVGGAVVCNLAALASGILIESNRDPSEESAGVEVARVQSPTTRGLAVGMSARPILLATEAGVVR